MAVEETEGAVKTKPNIKRKEITWATNKRETMTDKDKEGIDREPKKPIPERKEQEEAHQDMLKSNPQFTNNSKKKSSLSLMMIWQRKLLVTSTITIEKERLLKMMTKRQRVQIEKDLNLIKILQFSQSSKREMEREERISSTLSLIKCMILVNQKFMNTFLHIYQI